MDPGNAERLQWMIEHRHSSRAPYDPQLRVTEQELTRIIYAARWAPTAHNMQNFRLVVVDDPQVLEQLGQIGSSVSSASAGQLPPLGDVIAGAPAVIIALFDPTVHGPDPEGELLGVMSLGCVLENMWLTAHADHLDVQVMSALASAGTEVEVKRALSIPPPWRIAFALRVGHAVSTPALPRVRRDPAAIVDRNRFGGGSQ